MKLTSKPYSLKEITLAVQGKIIGDVNSVISEVLTDSRSEELYSNAIFFCIKGERQDGHRFIAEMVEKGVNNFVVERGFSGKIPNCNYIEVENSLRALQTFSAHHRKKFSVPCLGITGSNGKTIVKEWLYQLMSPDKNIVRSPKSYNSQVGVPLSVLQLDHKTEFAIFEAGISKVGEMQQLENIIRPNYGIFTNIGEAHSANFTSHFEKAKEKATLFLNSEVVFCSADHKELMEAITEKGMKKIHSWSKNGRGDLNIESIRKEHFQTEIKGNYSGKKVELRIPFIDEASIENALHCWLFLLHEGYASQTIQERFNGLSNVEMRLEMKEGLNDCVIINDAYNSDIPSIRIALDFLQAQSQHSAKTVILSDVLQSKMESETLYAQIAALLNNKKGYQLIGIGKEIEKHASLFRIEKKLFFKSTDAFLREYDFNSLRNQTILIKGARNFEFEKISHVLERKTHETVLEVNLTSLIHNLNYYKSILSPSTKVMVMVKAFGYGSGGYEIAKILEYNRVDYLAVAYIDEGVELRAAGIKTPIVVMSPEPTAFDVLIEHQLEPEIFSLQSLKQCLSYLDKKTLGKPLPIHIKVDTGMKRLGFDESDLTELAVLLAKSEKIKVASVFTHLAGSDDETLDDFTKQQIKKFNFFCERIKKVVAYDFLRHALNSSGIERFPEFQFDMVRMGIGLHGFSGSAKGKGKLLTVSTLKSVVAQIKKVNKGESVGYSRKAIVNNETTIAVISIGYADGFNRKLSNGVGKVFINGFVVPIIGNVCMDMCMADITDLPISEGDEVEVFGLHISIEEIAKSIDTIPYEILTSISRRVKRVYIQE